MRYDKEDIKDPLVSLVIPVYNGEAEIERCLLKWTDVLADLDYEITVINDGSTDQTGMILDSLAKDRDDHRLRIVHQVNGGHGPAIRKGYEIARGKWVFQADSDNEIEPRYFSEMWEERDEADIVLAEREGRSAGLIRRIITSGEGGLTYLIGRTALKDPNVPFRLIRRNKLLVFCDAVRPDEFAPNVLMSLWALRKDWKIKVISLPHNPIHQSPGSLGGMKLLKGCLAALRGVIRLLRL
jgi:dolichol-phosphate mannosyltransferase